MKRKLLSVAIALTAAFTFYHCSDTEELGLTEEQSMRTSSNDEQSTSSTTATSETPFTADVGAPITGLQVRSWVKLYKDKNPGKAFSHFVGVNSLRQMIDQENLVGVSFTYALDEKGNQQLVLIGVDANGKLMLPSATSSLVVGDFESMDRSIVCPPICPQ
jgi:hypothetical protein